MLKKRYSLRDLQEFTGRVYGEPDDRHYDTWELFSNQERFMMRALKGIRKGDRGKLRINIVIAFSWFMTIANRLHIDLEDATWQRFPGVCSYCGAAPCRCGVETPARRPKVSVDISAKPRTLAEFQEVFRNIYPPETRSLEHAGIHLAEEQGEVSEAIQLFMGLHRDEEFSKLVNECADYVSCIFGVFNSAGFDISAEYAAYYEDGCHVCHQIPCVCKYVEVANFVS